MKNVYCVFENECFLFICDSESDAQEMILSLTEEHIYNSFLNEINKVGYDLALWVFQNAPKYGWSRYSIQKVRMIYDN